MAQFIAFAPNVEVNGQTILAIVNALPSSQDTFFTILSDNGLVDIVPNSWYSQVKWLAAFKHIYDAMGPHTLFMIGKAIPQNAIFPAHINDLEKALSSINLAYEMNHRGGEIGYYRLVSFNMDARIAVMECYNPYPSDFDRGIIMTMLRRFLPQNSVFHNVLLDTSKPSRLAGGDTCTYLVTW